MSPDDPRHGTHRGYVLGCRSDCCRIAHTHYMKLYRMGRRPRLVSALGTRRRIEALLALGWTCRDIGQRCSKGDEWARMVRRSTTVTSETAFIVAKVYDDMCSSQPTDHYYYERNRRMSARKGYEPPSAWFDIDDPDERPDPGYRATRYTPTELAAEWAFLERAGESINAAAQQLGVSVAAIEKAVERARKKVAA